MVYVCFLYKLVYTIIIRTYFIKIYIYIHVPILVSSRLGLISLSLPGDGLEPAWPRGEENSGGDQQAGGKGTCKRLKDDTIVCLIKWGGCI